MDIILDTLFDTNLGMIILGIFLLSFIIFEFWHDQNPKI